MAPGCGSGGPRTAAFLPSYRNGSVRRERHLAARDGLAAMILDRFRDLIGVGGEDVIGAFEHAIVHMHVLLRVQFINSLRTAGSGTSSSESPCTNRPPQGQGARKPKS